MKRPLIISLISGGLAAASLTGCGVGPVAKPAGSITVYLMPIGPVPQAQLDAAAAEVGTFNLQFVTLEPIPIDNALGDLDRRQLMAERVTTRLYSEARGRGLDADQLVFGITQADLFLGQHPDHRWVFAYQAPSQTVTVISTARMNPLASGQPADEGLLESRLRKYVARNLTHLVLRRDWSTDRKCVTYRRIEGVDDLDALGTARC